MALEYRRFQSLVDYKDYHNIPDDFLTAGYKQLAWGEDPSRLKRSERKVLYIDGITSTGKTTLLAMLNHAIEDAHFIPETSATIPEKFMNIGPEQPLIDQLRAEYWFYNQYVIKDRGIQQLTGNVISDRGVLGLFGYSNLLTGNNAVSIRIMQRALTRKWADGLYVFLTADLDTVKARLMKRNDASKISESEWENGMRHFVSILKTSMDHIAKAAQVPLIDTSDKSPEEVATIVSNLYRNI